MGTLAMALALTPGSVLPGAYVGPAGGAAASASVTAYNRALLWAGPLGSLLLDTATGRASELQYSAATVLGSSGSFTRFFGGAMLPGGLGLTATDAAGSVPAVWALSNGTTLALSGSRVALTAVPAAGSSLQLANGSALVVSDWYRYLLWAGRSGTWLYDTAGGVSLRLPSGAAVSLALSSLLMLHDTGTTVVPPGPNAQLSVSPPGVDGWLVAVNGVTAIYTLSATTVEAVVLPAPSTSLSLPPSGATPMVVRTPGSVLWQGRNSCVLYDTLLAASYKLPVGSRVLLGPNSTLFRHDSGTFALPGAGNLTAPNATAWAFTPAGGGPQLVWALGGAVTGKARRGRSVVVAGKAVYLLGVSRRLSVALTSSRLSWALQRQPCSCLALPTGPERFGGVCRAPVPRAPCPHPRLPAPATRRPRRGARSGQRAAARGRPERHRGN